MQLRKCPVCNGRLKIIYRELFDDRYGAPGNHSVYQCQNCGFGLTIPGLPKKDIGQFYARYYPLSHAVPAEIAQNPLPTNSLLVWFLGLGHVCHYQTKKGQTVLDIGCGSCRSLVEIKALGGLPYGIEPDPTAQKIAKALKLNVYQGFISNNPFQGMKFDLVTATQVIEHDPNPVTLFRSLKRKLAPGGRLIVSTPNLDSMMRRVWGPRWLHWHIPYHLSFYSRKSFIKLAELTGLRVLSIKTVTPNLWAILQWKTVSAKPTEGVPNPFWDGSKPLYGSKLILLTMHAIAFVHSRLLDLLGQGESWVVTLKRK